MTESSPLAEQPKTRGIVLTLWLVALVLLSLWSIYRWWGIYTDWADHGRAASILTEDWQYFVPIALTIVQLVGVAALWLWKFWGFYLFVGGWVLGLVYLLLLGVPANTALIGGLGVVILFVLVSQKREHFD